MSTADFNTANNESRCACTTESLGKRQHLARWTTAGGIVSALGICAACCLLPFVLLSLGIAGAWVGALDALSPYKWIFIASTAGLLGYGFYVVYWKAKPTCPSGSGCRSCRSSRSTRIALWVGTLLAVSGLGFEYIEPMLV
ncbi:MAG: mercuric transporter MerT family protein [Steroidobacter sp.]